MTVLKLDKVSVVLNETEIVHQISFALKPCEFVALLGPNGAGKTTLMRAAAGLVSYTGNIVLNGDELSSISAAGLGRSICYIPQGPDVHWPMTVKDVVSLGRLPYRSMLLDEGKQDREAVDNALDVTALTPFSDRRFDQLSGGEKSRVMVARALASGACLMLADEPTEALDPYNQIQVLELLRDQVEQGMSVIAILHDIVLAAQFADRIMLLHEGRCVEDGVPDKVLTSENLADVYRVDRVQDVDIGKGIWRRIK